MEGEEEQEQEEDDEGGYLCLEERLQIPAIPHCSPQSLQAAMQLVNIQILAFTPPSTLPWRVYLYTHTQYGNSDKTLILGELLHTGETNQSPVLKNKIGEKDVAVGGERGQVMHLDQNLPSGKATELKNVKVTLKQQPSDERALKGFFSILITVLQTLSSERD